MHSNARWPPIFPRNWATAASGFPRGNPAKVSLALRVSVERLDVDNQGRGTLIARWNIEAPDSSKVLKGGESSFTKSGPVPHDDPASIAATLNDLTAQFSEVLARAIRECAPTSPPR